jgi:hypothetical protein
MPSMIRCERKSVAGRRIGVALLAHAALVRPRVLTRLADWLFWEPAHWVMQRRQFAGLRRRATASTRPPGA